MRKKKIALCDSDEIYVGRLLKQLNLSSQSGEEFVGITKISEKDREDIDLWLLSGDFRNQKFTKGKEEKAIILSEGEVYEWEEGISFTAKYQSSKNLIKEIYKSKAWQKIYEEIPLARAYEIKVSVICSASRHPDLGYYAKGYAKEKGDEGRVLLIDLREGVFYEYEKKKENISDILDVLCAIDANIESKDLRGFVYEYDEVDVIMPPYQIGQTNQISADDISAILNSASKMGIYKNVVIIGTLSFEGLISLMLDADEGIVVDGNWPSAQRSTRQFEENFNLQKTQGRGENIKYISLPLYLSSDYMQWKMQIEQEESFI